MTGNCTVVRVRPPGYDGSGDPIPGEPTRTPMAGAIVAPRMSSDISDRGRQGVVVGLSLYLPFGVGWLHTDLAEITGLGSLDGTYEADGDAGSWRGLSGWEAGDEIALRRAAG